MEAIVLLHEIVYNYPLSVEVYIIIYPSGVEYQLDKNEKKSLSRKFGYNLQTFQGFYQVNFLDF